jgi:CubicO group peptidase (beta-lactamase class C family)
VGSGAGLDASRIERVGQLGRWYVDQGKLPGAHVIVSRRGQVRYADVYGMADIGLGRKLTEDAIYRIYSMTKPIVSVALMMLYEQGRCLLEDRVSRYIPAFADLEVFAGGDADRYITVPPEREVTIRDLLAHTSGLTAGFIGDHPVEQLYRRRSIDGGNAGDLAAFVERLCTVPLLFSPGTRWNYGCSTDVLGRVVEVLSGERLDDYLRRHIFEPLGMEDTGFFVPPEATGRFTANYRRRGNELVETDSSTNGTFLRPPEFLSGAGGLVSTAADYQRFLDMLLSGGALDGVRILGRKTLEYMTLNHLPGNVDLNELGQSSFAETAMDGVGFGLGFSVVVDPAKLQVVCSVGEFGWGGAASTVFWVDRAEELWVLFLTQFSPSQYYPIRRQLRAAVYQALTD